VIVFSYSNSYSLQELKAGYPFHSLLIFIN
jgi:hypothetical protein